MTMTVSPPPKAKPAVADPPPAEPPKPQRQARQHEQVEQRRSAQPTENHRRHRTFDLTSRFAAPLSDDHGADGCSVTR